MRVRRMLTTIDRQTLRQRLGAVVLIEALPAAHFAREHLPTAVNLPDLPDEHTARALIPQHAAPVVVYCSGVACTRSRATAAALARLGYTDVRVYEGGKADWADAGLPFESLEEPATASLS